MDGSHHRCRDWERLRGAAQFKSRPSATQRTMRKTCVGALAQQRGEGYASVVQPPSMAVMLAAFVMAAVSSSAPHPSTSAKST